MQASRNTSAQPFTRHYLTVTPVCLACLLATGGSQVAVALPEGAKVTQGTAQITQPAGNKMEIRQGTDRASIDWNSFSIGTNESLRVLQPSSSSVLVNRVTGSDPSQIFGRLDANGRVFLTNPRGIVFGRDAQVDVGGLLATTMTITADPFNPGRYALSGGDTQPGEIVVDGQIRSSGTVAFAGPQISLNGVIDAKRIAAAAANQVQIDVDGDGLVFFNPRNDEGLQARLKVLGRLQADGGVVDLRAAARAGIADTVLNVDGVVQAKSMGSVAGRVYVDGGPSGVVSMHGSIDVSADGARGGSITVLGEKLGLFGTASLDASGSQGGGQVLLGGNYQGKGPERNASAVFVDKDAELRADARAQGDGGRIIVWSDHSTRLYGLVSAQGAGTGAGGFAEVSGKDFLDFAGRAQLGSSSGKLGTLLLDPTDLTIDNSANVRVTNASPFEPNNNGGSTLLWTTINNALSGAASVIVQTVGSPVTGGDDGTIRITDSPATLQGSGTLTFNAAGNIAVSSAVTRTGSGSIVMTAAKGITVGANISMTGGDLTLTANGGNVSHTAGAITSRDLTVSSSGTTSLRAVVLSRDLNITAGNDIGQTGAISVDGATTLTAKSNTINVAFNDANNELNAVTLLGTGGGKFGAVSIGDKDTAANGLTVGGAGTTTGNTDLTVTAGGALVFSGGSLKTVVATAQGDITQTGALITGAVGSSFTAAGGQSINLGTQANNFFAAPTLAAASGNLLNLGYRDQGDIAVGATTVTGTLALVSDTGNITQTGVLTVGADGSSFTTSTAGKTIDLGTQTNAFAGKTAAFSTSGTAGDASFKADAIKFATSGVGGKLTAVATTGDITQAGAITTGAVGSSFTAAGGQSINLGTQANNFFAAPTLAAASGNLLNLGYRDQGDIAVGATTVTGTLALVSDTGNITQTGVLTVGADGSSFTTSTAGKTIDLGTQTNVFAGKTAAFSTSGAAGDASFKADAIKFATSGVGGKLTAVATTGDITQAGAITTGAVGSSFTAAGGQSINLGTQANNFFAAPTLAAASGNLLNLGYRDQGDIAVGATTVTGTLALVSDTGNITQTGVLTVGADGSSFTTSTAGKTIDLGTQTNVFAGKTAAFSTSGAAGDASFKADAIKFATSGVGGKLTATAATGGITQTGVITVGADGSSFTTSTANQAINLGTQTNVLNGKTVAVNTSGATGDASLTADAIKLATSTVGGKLTATATTGGITQTGVITVGADGSSFTTSTANQAINLGTSTNVLNGKTVAFSTSGAAGDASLTADAIKFAASTVGGKLTATAATGGITQTGVITVGADGSSFTTSTANQTINLGTSTNVLNGKTVAFSTSGASGDASLTADAIKFAASTVGGKLTATAATGGITQSGAVTTGATGSSFTAPGGQSINLGTQANSFTGTPAFGASTGNLLNLAYRNGGDVDLGVTTLTGELTLVSDAGDITQSGVITVGADGSSFTTSTAGKTIDLSTQTNVLNGKTVAFSTSGAAGDASLTADAIKFATSAVGGKLTATATTGGITQSGAITTGAAGSSFTAAAGQSINLGTQANSFTGTPTFTASAGNLVNLAYRNVGNVALGATTLDGALTLVSDTGSITQSGVITVGADGSSFTTNTAGKTIDLGTQANVLNGKTVAFSTSGAAGDASLTADAIKFATSTVGGKLTATATTGGITQIGVITVGADGSSFTTSAANQTINLATQANVLNGKTVALNTSGATGDASLTADAVKFATSTVGGKLTATAATGGITQTGVITVGADGSSFTTSTANQAINLGTQTNVLNGKTVAFSTSGATGDASVTADAIKLATSTVGGKLTATAATGGITQTGVITVGADGSSFTTNAANQAINLGASTNVLNGKTVAFSTSGAAGDASLAADAIKFAASTVGGKLTATAATGGITQSGAVTTGATGSSFTAAGGQSINLGTQANSFAGTLTFAASAGSLLDLGYRNLGDVDLGATTLTGALTLVSDAGNITQSGAITVGADGSSFTTNTAGKTIDLGTQANVLNGKTVAFSTSGAAGDASLTADAIKFATSTVGGKLTATATTGGITQIGVITVGADGSSFTTSAANQTINLATQANVLNGKTVALNTSGATGDASLTADAVKFATSTVGGKLTATAATGGITQTGVITVGADGSSFTTSTANQAINLGTQTNVLNGKTVAFSTSGATGDASVTADAIKLATSTVGGKLTATAGTGGITQSGAITTGATGSSFTAAAGQSINLGTQANSFTGTPTFTASAGNLVNLAYRNVGNVALGATTLDGALTLVSDTGSITQSGVITVGADGSSFTTSAANQAINLATQANVLNGKSVAFSTGGVAGDVSLTADAIKFATSTVGGKLTATASTGDITQSGAITVGADGSSFTTSTVGKIINLGTAANVLNGKTVAFSTSGTTGDASLTADAIEFAASTVGGKLMAAAGTGGITQSGALTTGATGSSFMAPGGQSINLGTQANSFTGTLTFTASTGNLLNLAYRNVGNVTLGTTTLGGALTLVSDAGDIAQSGAITVGADSSSFTTSTAGKTIDLGTQANVLNGKTVAFSTSGATGDASVTADAIKFATSTVGGKLTATAATGGITQTGVITVGADGSSFTTNTAGKTIDLGTQANVLNGKTVAFSTSGAGGDASLTADAIKFAASTVGGKLAATAATGGITQTGVVTVGADGSSFTTSTANQAINLGTSTNVLNGRTIAFSTSGATGDASLTADAIKFATSTVGGKLAATAVTGGITQTGVITVGADGSSFTTNTANQAINLGTSTNVLNGKTVAFSTSGAAGDASLTADAIKFAASTVGGKLTATAATGGITQAGVITVGADGSSFTTNTADQVIDLATQANVLNGKTVAFSTSGAAGDASLTADAIKFAASTVGGKLTATAATGGIAQTGAITVGADGSSFTTSAANQAINLGTASNVLNGKTVAFSTSGALGDASLTADAIRFATSTVGGKLTATASAGGISQSGALAVAGVSTFGAAGVTLNNAANDFTGAVGVTSSGAADVHDANALTITFNGSGPAAATAVNALTATLNATGGTTLSGGSVTSSGTSGGLTTISGSTTTFGDSSVVGALDVTGTGAVSQTGALTVTGVSTFRTGSGAVTLNNTGNKLQDVISATGTGAVSISNDWATNLGAMGGSGPNQAAASLSVGTTGNQGVTQSGAAFVSGATVVTAGSGAISLMQANDFTGGVTLTSSADSRVNDVNALTVAFNGGSPASATAGGALAATLNGTGATTLTGGSVATSGTSGSLTTASASTTTFGGSTVGGNLSVTGAGVATQSDVSTAAGALIVAGTSTFGVGAGAVSLANVGNKLTGAISSTGTGAVTINNDQVTNLGAMGGSGPNQAVASLSVSTTTHQGVTQSGAAFVNGATTVAAGNGAISLMQANDFAGNVTLTSAATSSVNGINGLTVAFNGGGPAAATAGGALMASLNGTGGTSLSGGSVASSGTSGALTINSAGVTSLGTSVVTGDLGITGGAVSQASAADTLTVSGAAAINAGGATVSLGNAGNDFQGAVAITTTGAAGVRDANALNVSFTNTGSAVARAGGALAAVLSNSGVTSLTGAGVSSRGTSAGLSIASTGSTSLGASTIGGNLAIDSSGAVTQSGDVMVSGTTSINAGAAAVTLADAGNDFQGAVGIATTGAASVRDANALSVSLTGTAATSARSGGALSATLSNTGASSLVSAGDTSLVAVSATSLLVNSGGPVTQVGALNLPMLELQGAGAVQLLNAANVVDKLAVGDGEGAVRLVNAAGLTVDAVGATQGIKRGADVLLRTETGNLTIVQPIDVGTHALRLVAANGAISQSGTGAITAGGLAARASGAVALDTATNALSGPLSVVAGEAVGLKSATGYTIGGFAADVAAPSAWVAQDGLAAPGKLVTLDTAGGTVKQDAGKNLVAGSLVLKGSGAVTLENADNDVAKIAVARGAAAADGAISYRDKDGFDITAVGAVDGITRAGKVTLGNSAGTAVFEGLNTSAPLVQVNGGSITVASPTLTDGKVSVPVFSLGGDIKVNQGAVTLAVNKPAAVDDGLLSTYQQSIGIAKEVVLKDALGKQIRVLADVIVQTSGSLAVAAQGRLNLVADAGGSASLMQAGNQFVGGLSAKLASVPAAATSSDAPARSLLRVTGKQVNVTGAGVEADMAFFHADALGTTDPAVIKARLSYSNTLGTNVQLPGLAISIGSTAFDGGGAPFGQVAVDIGRGDAAGTTAGINSGYITVLPKVGGDPTGTAALIRNKAVILLTGPETGSAGYLFFYDGAGKESAILVKYNGYAPSSPQADGALSSIASVSEAARRDRFEEAVRTENVASRLRGGVITEVGPGRPATEGSSGTQPPRSCAPVGAQLGCAAGDGKP